MSKLTQNTQILDEVKIYVGTYKKYNDSSLFGEWFTLGDFESIEDFYHACKKLHSDEEYPELMFQDYECPEIFENLISECFIDENIFELAESLEGEDIEMINAFMKLGHDLTTENIEDAKERFFGFFENYSDIGEYFAEMLDVFANNPDLKHYFDFESYGENISYDFAEMDGYYFTL